MYNYFDEILIDDLKRLYQAKGLLNTSPYQQNGFERGFKWVARNSNNSIIKQFNRFITEHGKDIHKIDHETVVRLAMMQSLYCQKVKDVVVHTRLFFEGLSTGDGNNLVQYEADVQVEFIIGCSCFFEQSQIGLDSDMVRLLKAAGVT